MGQRLGIAAALLGDPATLILDEPVNGLDPEGILWIRNLLKQLAAEGRTVFVSSHLMSEMALTADHLIVIGRGRLIADTSVEDFVAQRLRRRRRPRALRRSGRLRELLAGQGVARRRTPATPLQVTGLTSERDRRARRRARHRPVRADAAAGLAGGGVHGTDPRRRRVPRRPGRAGRHEPVGEHAASSTAVGTRQVVPASRSARSPSRTGRSRSEWTKLWSLRSTRWSLLVALVVHGRPRHRHRRGADEPLERDLSRTTAATFNAVDAQPRRLPPRAARDRRARRAGDHRRVLDRHDPLQLRGRPAPAAGAVGQARACSAR